MKKIILSLFVSITANADILKETMENCSTERQACYDLGVMRFQAYEAQKIKEIKARTDDKKWASYPYAKLHGRPTKYSALLIHGLNDSPYYMKNIAKILHSHGMNVITILLPGHGLTIRDMEEIQYQEWISEMRKGLRMAADLGESVLVGGFSTGGVLASVAATETELIGGYLLFAPAFEMQFGNRRSHVWCIPGLNKLKFETDLQENPSKYGKRSANSVCQLGKLVARLTDKIDENMFFSRTKTLVRKLAAKIKAPTFVVLTTEDQRVPYETILDFASQLRVPQKTLVYTPDVSKIKSFPGVEIVQKSLQHSDIVLKENAFSDQQNPAFYTLEESLKEFLNANFAR
jgi:esterase/lipase